MFAFIALEMRFPPSVAKSKRGWRTAMHLLGRNEVEKRNGACVMEVASLGSRAKMRAKEGGKTGTSFFSAGMKWNGIEPSPIGLLLLSQLL